MGITPDPFVGRQGELAELTAALEGVLAGQGRIVMLVGEPGIGKTRLAEEFAQIAKHRGVEVLWGRCREERGAPPFWPWTQALETHVEAAPGEALRTELGTDAPVVAEIVTAVRGKLVDLERVPAIEDPEAARFRLFSGLASFLKRASRSRPVLIVLDDLHWADAASLRFLEFLVPDLPSTRLLVLGTYRDVEVSRHTPLARTLGELVRQRSSSRVVLRGIDIEATGSIVRGAGLTRLSRGFVSEIHSQTEGNPLFVGETVRLLVQQGFQTRERPEGSALRDFRLPDGIREAIGRRLDRLSPECNELLTTAAVIGRRFALPALVKLHAGTEPSSGERWSEDRIIELVEEALRARIIEELPSGPGRYQFSHALIAETLATEISTTRRVRLHARIALALEELYGKSATAQAAELARHFSEAETVLGPERVIKYSTLAGEQALASFAHEEALGHFERALAAKGTSQDAVTAGILFGLGRAQSVTLGRHEIQRAIDTLGESFDLFLSLGDPSGAINVARFPIPVYHGTERVTAMLARALELADAASVDAGSIVERCALFASMERLELRADLFERAIEAAVGKGDVNAELGARTWYAICLAFHLRSDDSVQMIEAALALLPHCTDHLLRWGALEIATSIRLFFRQEWRAALSLAESALEAARVLRAKYQLVFEYANLACAHSMLGNWEQARRYVDEGQELDPQDWRVLASDMSIAVALGDRERALAVLQQPGLNAVWLPPAREIAALGISPSDIVGCVERISAGLPGLEPLLRDGMVLARADALLAAGDYSGARGHYDSIKSQIASVSDHPLRRTRRLAQVVLAMGDRRLATSLFEETIEFCRESGAEPVLGLSLHDYADMLLAETGALGAEDAKKVTGLLDEAEPMAARLGMKPLEGRLADLRRKLADRAGSRPAYPDALTEREVEVLRLVAGGRSNSEIAAALVITQNTAAKHVANILSKIGAANRTEAASYAIRHRLTDAQV